MDYLYNKKRLTILDSTCEDQIKKKKKINDFYCCPKTRFNLICLPIESIINFEEFFFFFHVSLIFDRKISICIVDNEDKNDQNASRDLSARLLSNSNVHNLENLG